MKAKRLLILALAAIGAAAYGGKVLATPATTPGFSGTTLAKATFGDLGVKPNTIPADLWKVQLKTMGIPTSSSSRTPGIPASAAGACHSGLRTRVPGRAS